MNTTTEILGQVIETGVHLIGQFNEGDAADPVRTEELFRTLIDRVTDLPPGILDPQFHKNIRHWPRMWRTRDYKAARYQMTLLVKQLRGERDERLATEEETAGQAS